MLQDTKKYIRDVMSIRVKNILYYIFFELGVLGKHGGTLEGSKKISFETTRVPKKTS
jgi:hypothetical protein